MQLFHIMGILISLAAVFSFINHHYIPLPKTVGLMLQSLVLSGALILLDSLGLGFKEPAQQMVRDIEFDRFLLQAVLSFLLFSEALFTDLAKLKKVKLDIALLVLVGVALSTLLVGFSLFHVSNWLGLGLRPVYCFIFGALISPTDPIAVIATLKKIGIGDRTEARITGEALFNDGVGIVLFLSLLHMSQEGGGTFEAGQILILFAREALGGVILGFAVGGIGFLLLRGINNYSVEILITLAMVSGGYSLAQVAGVSGPLAMVVAGLMIGSHGRTLAMSEITVENLDRFWEVVEDILNTVLFTLIGLEILILLPDITLAHLILGATSILIVLASRFLTVGGISLVGKRANAVSLQSISLLTWAGIRGGISIALALSLPSVPERGFLLVSTYMVALFSLLIQATTVERLVKSRKKSYTG